MLSQIPKHCRCSAERSGARRLYLDSRGRKEIFKSYSYVAVICDFLHRLQNWVTPTVIRKYVPFSWTSNLPTRFWDFHRFRYFSRKNIISNGPIHFLVSLVWGPVRSNTTFTKYSLLHKLIYADGGPIDSPQEIHHQTLRRINLPYDQFLLYLSSRFPEHTTRRWTHNSAS